MGLQFLSRLEFVLITLSSLCRCCHYARYQPAFPQHFRPCQPPRRHWCQQHQDQVQCRMYDMIAFTPVAGVACSAIMTRAVLCSAVSWQCRHARQLSCCFCRELRRWREAELTHGRVAMLAAVGFIVQVRLTLLNILGCVAMIPN